MRCCDGIRTASTSPSPEPATSVHPPPRCRIGACPIEAGRLAAPSMVALTVPAMALDQWPDWVVRTRDGPTGCATDGTGLPVTGGSRAGRIWPMCSSGCRARCTGAGEFSRPARAWRPRRCAGTGTTGDVEPTDGRAGGQGGGAGAGRTSSSLLGHARVRVRRPGWSARFGPRHAARRGRVAAAKTRVVRGRRARPSVWQIGPGGRPAGDGTVIRRCRGRLVRRDGDSAPSGTIRGTGW